MRRLEFVSSAWSNQAGNPIRSAQPSAARPEGRHGHVPVFAGEANRRRRVRLTIADEDPAV